MGTSDVGGIFGVGGKQMDVSDRRKKGNACYSNSEGSAKLSTSKKGHLGASFYSSSQKGMRHRLREKEGDEIFGPVGTEVVTRRDKRL